MLGTHNIRGKMLEIGNTYKGNTWNRQCVQKERLKSQIHVKKTLGIVKKLRDVKDILEYVNEFEVC